MFSSSRTLPGQLYSARTETTSGGMVTIRAISLDRWPFARPLPCPFPTAWPFPLVRPLPFPFPFELPFPFPFSPGRPAVNRARKCSISTGMSSRRARSGGTAR